MMNYEVIYDVEKDAFPMASLVCIVIAIAVFSIAGKSIWSMIVQKEKDFWEMFLVIVLIFFAGLFCKMAYTSYINQIGTYVGIHAELYFNGEYEVVEGEIQDFYSDRQDESFTVNNIRFHYRKDIPILGYFWNSEDRLAGNGQYVRVTYVEEGNLLYIVKLEIGKKS